MQLKFWIALCALIAPSLIAALWLVQAQIGLRNQEKLAQANLLRQDQFRLTWQGLLIHAAADFSEDSVIPTPTNAAVVRHSAALALSDESSWMATRLISLLQRQLKAESWTVRASHQQLVGSNMAIQWELEAIEHEIEEVFNDLQDSGTPFADTTVLLQDLRSWRLSFPTELQALQPWLIANFSLQEKIAGQLAAWMIQRHEKIRAQAYGIGVLLLTTLVLCSSLGALFFWRLVAVRQKIFAVYQHVKAGHKEARYPVAMPKVEEDQLGLIFNQLLDDSDAWHKLLSESVKSLTDTTSMMSQVANHQHTVISEQEVITQEIAFSANQIVNTANVLASSMSDIDHVATKASSLAVASRYHLQQLEQIMQRLIGASNELVAALHHLHERIKGIANLVTAMVHLADRTNMLAINTALEAAKLQQYGSGFGLIAGEMRCLADQSAQAIFNIEQFVAHILSLMDSSVHAVQGISGDILNSIESASAVQHHFIEILDSVENLSAKYSTVTNAMQAQLQKANAMDASLRMLQKVAQHSSDSVHSFQATLSNVDSCVHQLQHMHISAVDN